MSHDHRDPDGDGEEGLALGAIFTDPPRPPSPEPTIAVYENMNHQHHLPNPCQLEDSSQCQCQCQCQWNTISVRLVGSHPLWGHYLWNAARALACFLQRNPDLYAGQTVLELGAGGGLPSLVVAKCGARKVVLTDYPDGALVDNLVFNVEKNIETARRGDVCILGYVWGQPVDPLLRALSPPGMDTADPEAPRASFDLILLSDLIFNHSQHRALLTTCERAIAPGGCVLVFFTHHRPHLARRDMEFFDMARESGWECEKVLTERFPPMFPEDPGEEEVRSTVHGWKLTRT